MAWWSEGDASRRSSGIVGALAVKALVRMRHGPFIAVASFNNRVAT